MAFYFTHAKAYPEPMWFFGRTKILVAGLAVSIVLFILSAIFPALSFPFGLLGICFLTFYMNDSISAASRQDKFNRAIIEKGAEVIDPWNKRIIVKNSRTANLVLTMLCLIIIIFMAFFLLFWRRLFEHYIINYPFYLMPSIVAVTGILNRSIYPILHYCAFLDFDEGMLFGNAVFSYEIMSGLVSTGKGNGFELYHEGRKVATGNILPDDLRHLREILEILEKYRDVSVNE
jgi:hypothetical protein